MPDDLEGGTESETSRKAGEELREQRQKAQAEKKRWAQRLVPLVQHDSWGHLMASLEQDIRDLRVEYDKAQTMDQVASIRGEIRGIERLLQLRKKVQSSL